MIAFPCVKINLGLYISGKRTDGFHDIKSIFYPVPFGDMVEVISSGESPRLYASGIPVPGKVSDNLCMKAYDLIREKHGLPGSKVFLHKLIPIGSGLGGGSSDAVAVLKLCNEHFGLELDKSELKDYAAELGSDCPFFVDEKPALVSGRGDKMKDAEIDLDGFSIIIVHTGNPISTAEAYRNVEYQQPDINLEELHNIPLKLWRKKLQNCFEPFAFEKYPELENIKKRFYNSGAIYASMTGSGSAIFGIYDKKIDENTLFPKKDYFVKRIQL